MHEETNIVKLILESNVINFTVALIAIVYLLGKMLPQSKNQRKQELEREISLAKEARDLAQIKLTELEQQIAEAKAESVRIVSNAKEMAEKLRYKVMEEAKIEIDKINHSATKEIEMQKVLAIESIRKEIAHAAIAETEKALKTKQGEIDDLIKNRVKQDLAEMK